MKLIKSIAIVLVVAFFVGIFSVGLCFAADEHSCCNSGADNHCHMSSVPEPLSVAESNIAQLFAPEPFSFSKSEPIIFQTLQVVSVEDAKTPPGFLASKVNHPSIAPPLA